MMLPTWLTQSQNSSHSTKGWKAAVPWTPRGQAQTTSRLIFLSPSTKDRLREGMTRPLVPSRNGFCSSKKCPLAPPGHAWCNTSEMPLHATTSLNVPSAAPDLAVFLLPLTPLSEARHETAQASCLVGPQQEAALQPGRQEVFHRTLPTQPIPLGTEQHAGKSAFFN